MGELVNFRPDGVEGVESRCVEMQGDSSLPPLDTVPQPTIPHRLRRNIGNKQKRYASFDPAYDIDAEVWLCADVCADVLCPSHAPA